MCFANGDRMFSSNHIFERPMSTPCSKHKWYLHDRNVRFCNKNQSPSPIPPPPTHIPHPPNRFIICHSTSPPPFHTYWSVSCPKPFSPLGLHIRLDIKKSSAIWYTKSFRCFRLPRVIGQLTVCVCDLCAKREREIERREGARERDREEESL